MNCQPRRFESRAVTERVSGRVCPAKISHRRKTGATIECGGSFAGALDWVQRFSAAADNNRIYAEGLVTSRQTHLSVASFQLC
jgi:hypothetical protein